MSQQYYTALLNLKNQLQDESPLQARYKLTKLAFHSHVIYQPILINFPDINIATPANYPVSSFIYYNYMLEALTNNITMQLFISSPPNNILISETAIKLETNSGIQTCIMYPRKEFYEWLLAQAKSDLSIGQFIKQNELWMEISIESTLSHSSDKLRLIDKELQQAECAAVVIQKWYKKLKSK